MSERLPIEQLRYNGRQDAVLDFRSSVEGHEDFVKGTIVVRTDVGDFELCFMQLGPWQDSKTEDDHFCIDIVLNRTNGKPPERSTPLSVFGLHNGRSLEFEKDQEHLPTVFSRPGAGTFIVIAERGD